MDLLGVEMTSMLLDDISCGLNRIDVSAIDKSGRAREVGNEAVALGP
jgi:hypothetical protein